LQLALENAKLREAQAAYFDALRSAGESADDIVGYVFAINGKSVVMFTLRVHCFEKCGASC